MISHPEHIEIEEREDWLDHEGVWMSARCPQCGTTTFAQVRDDIRPTKAEAARTAVQILAANPCKPVTSPNE